MKRSSTAALIAVLLAVATAPAGAGDIVDAITARVPRHPHSYAEVMAALQELHLTDRVRCW
ncbi:MAG: hypothetical protein ACP5KN_16585, partial [Armatimonadota bacterium]